MAAVLLQMSLCVLFVLVCVQGSSDTQMFVSDHFMLTLTKIMQCDLRISIFDLEKLPSHVNMNFAVIGNKAIGLIRS